MVSKKQTIKALYLSIKFKNTYLGPAKSAASNALWFKSQHDLAKQLILNQSLMLPESLKFDPDWINKAYWWRQNDKSPSRCYAYASNRHNDGPIRPGHFAGAYRKKNLELNSSGLNIGQFHKILKADGLLLLDEDKAKPRMNGWVVAAFLSKDSRQFHFKRLDSNGEVSDKPGSGEVRLVASLRKDGFTRVLRALMSYMDETDNSRFIFVGLFLLDPEIIISRSDDRAN